MVSNLSPGYAKWGHYVNMLMKYTAIFTAVVHTPQQLEVNIQAALFACIWLLIFLTSRLCLLVESEVLYMYSDFYCCKTDDFRMKNCDNFLIFCSKHTLGTVDSEIFV